MCEKNFHKRPKFKKIIMKGLLFIHRVTNNHSDGNHTAIGQKHEFTSLPIIRLNMSDEEWPQTQNLSDLILHDATVIKSTILREKNFRVLLI